MPSHRITAIESRATLAAPDRNRAIHRMCIAFAARTLAVASASACNGDAAMALVNAADPEVDVEAPGSGLPDAQPPQGPGACTSGAAPARLWRLSHQQYDNTVAALLGTALTPGVDFEPEVGGSGFSGGADTAWVSVALAEQYMIAAEKLATAAVAEPSKLLPCTPANPADAGCVRQFIAQFGKRAFRQPMTDAQIDVYFSLYQGGLSVSANEGLQRVLEAMLQSPHFLYRRELGAPASSGAIVTLTDWELATQLSYLLWDISPDEALLSKAEQGGLATEEALSAEVERMLKDPRAQPFLRRFLVQHLGITAVDRVEKDDEVFPEFTAELAVELRREAEAFIDHVVWKESGTLHELLTADYTLLNERLAGIYGVQGVTGDELRKVALPSEQRAGLLTHAGLLASLGHPNSGSPVQRGLLVRRQLLCHEIPPPPPNVDDAIETPTASHTTRERYQALASRLAGSRQVGECIATNFWRFALGRQETETDGCGLQAVQTRFLTSGTDMKELARALTQTEAFTHRGKP